MPGLAVEFDSSVVPPKRRVCLVRKIHPLDADLDRSSNAVDSAQ